MKQRAKRFGLAAAKQRTPGLFTALLGLVID